MKRTQISRRGLLTSAAMAPVSALLAQSPAMRETLSAFCDRIVPADATGPGALEAAAPDYILRALGDYLAPERAAIEKSLADLDALAVASKGRAFAQLSASDRDAVLTSFAQGAETRAGFLRLRQLTLEGMFSDPFYGGNRNYAGWDLLRYPGPRLAVAADDQKLVMPKPVRRSARGASHGD